MCVEGFNILEGFGLELGFWKWLGLGVYRVMLEDMEVVWCGEYDVR